MGIYTASNRHLALLILRFTKSLGCIESPCLLQVVTILCVLGVSSAQLPLPGTIPGLSLEQQYEYILQLQQHLNTQVQWPGRRKRSLPVPGTTGLVPGSAAEAQWYQQQLAQIALINGRRKRSLPVPGTTGLVPGSTAEAQW